jgi:hypothetical protein
MTTVPQISGRGYRLGEQRVLVDVERADRLGVGRQRARADAEDEAAFGEMVEHRGLRRNQDGMLLRQVRGAGPELDLRGRVNQRRQERHRVGNVLAGIGEMLAHESAREAELVAEDDGFAILLERFGPVPMHRMHRHREVPQSHQRSSVCPAHIPAKWIPVRRKEYAQTRRHMTRLRGLRKGARG